MILKHLDSVKPVVEVTFKHCSKLLVVIEVPHTNKCLLEQWGLRILSFPSWSKMKDHISIGKIWISPWEHDMMFKIGNLPESVRPNAGTSNLRATFFTSFSPRGRMYRLQIKMSLASKLCPHLFFQSFTYSLRLMMRQIVENRNKNLVHRLLHSSSQRPCDPWNNFCFRPAIGSLRVHNV